MYDSDYSWTLVTREIHKQYRFASEYPVCQDTSSVCSYIYQINIGSTSVHRPWRRFNFYLASCVCWDDENVTVRIMPNLSIIELRKVKLSRSGPFLFMSRAWSEYTPSLCSRAIFE